MALIVMVVMESGDGGSCHIDGGGISGGSWIDAGSSDIGVGSDSSTSSGGGCIGHNG